VAAHEPCPQCGEPRPQCEEPRPQCEELCPQCEQDRVRAEVLEEGAQMLENYGANSSLVTWHLGQAADMVRAIGRVSRG
jgi:hypothetical protein